MLKILADENMPYVDQLFGTLGHVQTMAGREIVAADLVDIDILLVRSITKVNPQLLAQANKLKFVGSATIGTDHLDIDYLESNNIKWTNAPGCNATAVAEYVISALLTLQGRYKLTLHDKTVAIVGAGNIGQRLAKKLTALKIKHFFCDPPLARTGATGDFRDIEQVAQADIISLHVPIIRTGVDKTENLIDRDFLAKLKPDTIIINSCRGDVINNQDLLQCLTQGQQLKVVMDVWQHEPEINLDLMALVDIATPHIAGYSLEGKARGTYMLYQLWCQFNIQAVIKQLNDLLPPSAIKKIWCDVDTVNTPLVKLVRAVYDIRDDDDLCRAFATTGHGFDNLRKKYGVRREFSAVKLASSAEPLPLYLTQLGFTGE